MNTPVITPEEAFEVLQTYIENALAAAQESGSEAMRTGKFDQVQAALDRARALEKLNKRVAGVAGDFHDLIAEAQQVNEAARLRNGLKTPETTYYVPILTVLVELGGSANLNDVLDRVYDRVRDQLNEYDHMALPSDGVTPRWRNTAQWARNSLRQQGYLKNDSLRGIWEISDAGRDWLNKHS